MADNVNASERRVTPGASPPRTSVASAQTWPLMLIRILAAVGLCITVYLTILHAQAGEGGTFDSPLCTVSATINCNAVLSSVYARLFGLPIAIWAALTYVAILIVSFLSTTTALIYLCSWAFIFSLYMAWISLFTLKAGCVFCISLYTINTGIFIGALALVRQARSLGWQQLRYALAGCIVLAFGFGWAQAKLADLNNPQPNPPRDGQSNGFARDYEKLRQVTLTLGDRNTKGPAQATVNVSEFVDFR